MIKDLIRSIMRENAVESEEELMADNANSDIRDAFIGEDGEFDDTTDVTDAKIKDLIKNLPESNSNITSEEISELSESYLDVFEDSDYALESSVSIDSKITKCESVIESLDYKDSLTENEQQELKQAKRQLSVLTMVKESQSEDLDMDTLDDSDTVDVDEADEVDLSEDTDSEAKVKPDEEEGKEMTLDITEGFNDFDLEGDVDMIFGTLESYAREDDTFDSVYEGEVTLALEGARMRYLEELEKKDMALQKEMLRLHDIRRGLTGEKKKKIDEKLDKIEDERLKLAEKAGKYSGFEGTGSAAGHEQMAKDEGKMAAAGNHTSLRLDRQKSSSEKFKEDFGGPQRRGEYDPPVSRYKGSGTGPDKKQGHTHDDSARKESFIIDGEEVLSEESLYADDQWINDLGDDFF